MLRVSMIIQQVKDTQLLSSGTVTSLMIVKNLMRKSMDPKIPMLEFEILLVDSKIIKFAVESM